MALKRREQVDLVAVGVGHDGVALPSERVPGFFTAVAEGGQLRVLIVDGCGVGEEEGEGYPVSAGGGSVVGVDLPDKLRGVPGDAQAPMVVASAWGSASATSGTSSPSLR